MIKWIVKKYVVAALNKVMESRKTDVENTTKTIDKWIDRLQMTIGALKRINLRLSDGVIDDEEIEQSRADIEDLIRNF
jgi:hypothetical protein